MTVRSPILGFVAVAGAALALVSFAPGAGAKTAATDPAKARLDSLVAAESRVRWDRLPPDSAIVTAARQGRPAFLDFFADWCVPCRWMDRAVYSDPLLGEVAEAVAMVRVDIETPEGRRLAERYGVRQYPTLIYLAPDGREILRWPGPLSLRDTRLNLGQVALPSAGRAALEAERAKRPDDFDTQSRALLWYGWRGEVERVRALVDTLEKKRPKDGPRAATTAATLQLNLAKAEEIAGRRDRALAAYRRALALDPEGAFAWRAWLGVSAALEQGGDPAGALEAAREALRRNPQAWLAARVERIVLAAHQPVLATPPGIDPP